MVYKNIWQGRVEVLIFCHNVGYSYQQCAINTVDSYIRKICIRVIDVITWLKSIYLLSFVIVLILDLYVFLSLLSVKVYIW